MHGGGYLAHCKAEIEAFLGQKRRVLFVPFALADHDGYEVKTEGDAFMVAFQDAAAAVARRLQIPERVG